MAIFSFSYSLIALLILGFFLYAINRFKYDLKINVQPMYLTHPFLVFGLVFVCAVVFSILMTEVAEELIMFFLGFTVVLSISVLAKGAGIFRNLVYFALAALTPFIFFLSLLFAESLLPPTVNMDHNILFFSVLINPPVFMQTLFGMTVLVIFSRLIVFLQNIRVNSWLLFISPLVVALLSTFLISYTQRETVFVIIMTMTTCVLFLLSVHPLKYNSQHTRRR